jgi:hypothetical protein
MLGTLFILEYSATNIKKIICQNMGFGDTNNVALNRCTNITVTCHLSNSHPLLVMWIDGFIKK